MPGMQQAGLERAARQSKGEEMSTEAKLMANMYAALDKAMGYPKQPPEVPAPSAPLCCGIDESSWWDEKHAEMRKNEEDSYDDDE